MGFVRGGGLVRGVGVLFVAVLAVGAVGVSVAAAPPSVAAGQGGPALLAPDGGMSIMGPTLVAPAQMAAFFHRKGKQVAQGVEPVEHLAGFFAEEGAKHNIRGDFGFVQAIVESAWFSFPSYGQVRPSDHNFAGICAFDGAARTSCSFADDRSGISAQMGMLREAADAGYRHTLPSPATHWGARPGCCGTTRSLSGVWATNKDYYVLLESLWKELLAFAGVDPSRVVATPAVEARLASGDSKGAVAVEFGLAQLGKPYQWGAEGPDRFDCSGLVMAAWASAGVQIPRTTWLQKAALMPVSEAELQPGDLVFYGPNTRHVTMYVGDGKVVNAPRTGDVVKISPVHYGRVEGFARPGAGAGAAVAGGRT